MRRPRTLIGPGAMGGMVSLWGASSMIKSIQTGTATTTTLTGTATITAVNTANSILLYLGQGCADNSNTQPSEAYCRLTFTNATTITITRGGQVNPGVRSGNFVVIEFAPGVIKSIQHGTITISSGSSATATVTSVNTARSLLIHVGTSSVTISATINSMVNTMLTLTNATTVTLTMDANSAGAWTPIGGYTLVEFF